MDNLKDKIECNNMSEELVKKWLDKQNIDQVIKDNVLLGDTCNGLLLNQFWQTNNTSPQIFNHIFITFFKMKLDNAFNANSAREKIKGFADALEKLFN
jgi:hypothetical protein